MSTAVLDAIRVLQLERDAQQRTLDDLDQAIASLRRLTGDRVEPAASPTAKPARRTGSAERRATVSAARRTSRAAKTTRPASPQAATAARTTVHTTRAGMAAPAPRDVVAARDQAVLLRLQKGPAMFAQLRDALPVEPELTDEQRTRACSNALVRLRGRKQIQSADDGAWRLA